MQRVKGVLTLLLILGLAAGPEGSGAPPPNGAQDGEDDTHEGEPNQEDEDRRSSDQADVLAIYERMMMRLEAPQRDAVTIGFILPKANGQTRAISVLSTQDRMLADRVARELAESVRNIISQHQRPFVTGRNDRFYLSMGMSEAAQSTGQGGHLGGTSLYTDGAAAFATLPNMSNAYERMYGSGSSSSSGTILPRRNPRVSPNAHRMEEHTHRTIATRDMNNEHMTHFRYAILRTPSSRNTSSLEGGTSDLVWQTTLSRGADWTQRPSRIPMQAMQATSIGSQLISQQAALSIICMYCRRTMQTRPFAGFRQIVEPHASVPVQYLCGACDRNLEGLEAVITRHRNDAVMARSDGDTPESSEDEPEPAASASVQQSPVMSAVPEACTNEQQSFTAEAEHGITVGGGNGDAPLEADDDEKMQQAWQDAGNEYEEREQTEKQNAENERNPSDETTEEKKPKKPKLKRTSTFGPLVRCDSDEPHPDHDGRDGNDMVASV